MGFIGDILAATGSWVAPAASNEGAWRTIDEGYGAGVRSVTESMALDIPTVWDCNKILCDSVGSAPALLYDRTADEGRERAKGGLAYLLREQWNGEDTAIEFKRTMQQAANFYRYAYAEIEWSGTDPVAVYPMHPTRVKRVPLGGRRYRYEYLEDDGHTWRKLLPEQVLRIPGAPVLLHAEQTFQQALALMRYSTNTFIKGPKPATAIKAEKGVTFDKPARERIRAEITEASSGANAGGTLWVPEGLDIAPFGMTNEQAELSTLWGTVVGEITRYWRIPPYMVGLLESGTVSYASVDTQGVDFVVYTLMPWLVGWEQAIQRDLIVAKDSQFVEFLAAALMRGTTKERYEVYKLAIENGLMSPNEVRRLENLNPRQGGDIYRDINKTTTPTLRTAEKDSPAAHLLESLARDAAGRVVRRETGALAKLAENVGGDTAAWEAGVRDFYTKHASFVVEALKVAPAQATHYSDTQMWTVLADGPAAAATWYGPATEKLTTLALESAR